jgi:hypothetical protein
MIMWKAVAVIDGTEYYSEREKAVTALRRALSEAEDRSVAADLASD